MKPKYKIIEIHPRDAYYLAQGQPAMPKIFDDLLSFDISQTDRHGFSSGSAHCVSGDSWYFLAVKVIEL